jgi:hypothetical protein
VGLVLGLPLGAALIIFWFCGGFKCISFFASGGVSKHSFLVAFSEGFLLPWRAHLAFGKSLFFF